MLLLVIYLAFALGVSFCCSLCEAVLLTLTPSDAEVMIARGRRAGGVLKAMKERIDRPLAAILTLNTIANTAGAAGVGAQAAIVFGEVWLGLISGAMTLLVLVFSEIIPKTLGASWARPLAGPAVTLIAWMVRLTYPLVVLLNAISSLIRGPASESGHSREQIVVMAEMARHGGTLDQTEHRLITNMLRLNAVRVHEVMTPRTVVFMLPENATAAEAIRQPQTLQFSRIPVTGEGPDDVRGLVLKTDLLRAVAEGRPGASVGSMKRRIRAVPETAALIQVMKQFGETGQHLFLVVDEYGGTAGVISLEDLIESILGREIVDETDPAPDMRKVAEAEAERSSESMADPAI